MSRPTGKLRDMNQPTIADLEYHRERVAGETAAQLAIADRLGARIELFIRVAYVLIAVGLVDIVVALVEVTR